MDWRTVHPGTHRKDADTTARCYEPFDPRFVRGLIEGVLAPIIDMYFRPRLIGADRIPADGPLLLAANHSGNASPYETAPSPWSTACAATGTSPPTTCRSAGR